MKYEYDNTGVYFCYFVLSLLGLWLLPTTYWYIGVALGWNVKKSSPTEECKCEKCVSFRQVQQLKRKRTLKNPRLSRTFVLWVVGWFVFAFLLRYILTAPVEAETVLFDPYSILELDRLSTPTPEQVKKQFKRLSLKWHPDKNEDKETAQEIFITITKAYKVLTDDETRQNWEEYGDPDGKQSFSFGIALPSWIVDPDNKFFVLLVYALIFGVGLPVVVGRWWASSKKYTKDKVLNLTMGIFFQEMKEVLNTRKMLELLCTSVEFKENIPWRGERDMEAVMELFKSVRDVIGSKTGERLDLPKKYNAPYVTKAFVIAHAHLFRVPIADELLAQDAAYIVKTIAHLANKGLLQICSAQFWFNQSLYAVEISRMMIQAVPSAWKHTESSELHQLPHFAADKIKNLKFKKRNLKSVYQLMELNDTDRNEVLTADGFNDDQINDIVAVGSSIPKLSIMEAFFECSGEDVITPGSLVTLVVVLRAVTYDQVSKPKPEILEQNEKSDSVDSKENAAPVNQSQPNANKAPAEKPAKESQPATNDADDDDDDDDDGFVLDEDEEDSIEDQAEGQPRKKMSKLTKLLSGTYWLNPNKPVHCPYYPQQDPDENTYKRPNYLLWLCNPGNNRVVGNPVLVNNLVPCSIHTTNPKKGTRKIKFRFYSPSNPGNYTFSVVVQCDSYLGIDLRQEVKLCVKPLNEKDVKLRQQQEKEAWRDFDDEDKLERELLMEAANELGFGGPKKAAAKPSQSNDEEENEDDSSDDSSDESDDDD